MNPQGRDRPNFDGVLVNEVLLGRAKRFFQMRSVGSTLLTQRGKRMTYDTVLCQITRNSRVGPTKGNLDKRGALVGAEVFGRGAALLNLHHRANPDDNPISCIVDEIQQAWQVEHSMLVGLQLTYFE